MTDGPQDAPAHAGPGPTGPAGGDTSIFRKSALEHYMQGVEAPESAPIRRSKRLRWLWLAMALTAVAAGWVGMRPVPAFTDAQVALVEHECEQAVGPLVLVVDDAPSAALEAGRSVLLAHPQLGLVRLEVTSVAVRGAAPSELAALLGCPVDAGVVASGAVTVVGARSAVDGAPAPSPPAVLPGHIETHRRTLASLLPIWDNQGGAAP